MPVMRYGQRRISGEIPQQGPDSGVTAITLQNNVIDVDVNKFLIVTTIESKKRAVISANFLLVDDTLRTGTITFDDIFLQVNI